MAKSDAASANGNGISDGLSKLHSAISQKHAEYKAAMKQGDTAAARKAIAAENDLAAITRVSKRVESGFYN